METQKLKKKMTVKCLSKIVGTITGIHRTKFIVNTSNYKH